MIKTPITEQYIYFTNRNYHIASLVQERLEEVNSQHSSAELSALISRVIVSLYSEAVRLRNILLHIDETDTPESAEPTVMLLESIFEQVLPKNGSLHIIMLYDYLYIAEAMLSETKHLKGVFNVDEAQSKIAYDNQSIQSTMKYLALLQSTTDTTI